MMYEDIIKTIRTGVEMKIEDGVMKAVMGVGIHVDKDELIKALAYDREQYEKGYLDGQRAAVVHGRWIEHVHVDEYGDCSYIDYECAVCHVTEHFEDDGTRAFYPNCGAKMDLEE